NYLYIDTGAMYRAIALAVLEEGVGPDDGAAVERLARGLDVGLVPSAAGNRVLLGGRDVTERIPAPEASAAVSQVAALPGVRRRRVPPQRRLAARGRVRMAGPDPGPGALPAAGGSCGRRGTRRRWTTSGPTSTAGTAWTRPATSRRCAKPKTPWKSTRRTKPSTKWSTRSWSWSGRSWTRALPSSAGHRALCF